MVKTIKNLRNLEDIFKANELFKYLRESFDKEIIKGYIDIRLIKLEKELLGLQEARNGETELSSITFFTTNIDCLKEHLKDVKKIRQVLLTFISK